MARQRSGGCVSDDGGGSEKDGGGRSNAESVVIDDVGGFERSVDDADRFHWLLL